ncbi:hypothetical protein RCH21_000639 [Arthrobacter sp. PL16]|nr:hypothetical protein [Arthrobacter sp. PL16]
MPNYHGAPIRVLRDGVLQDLKVAPAHCGVNQLSLTDHTSDVGTG